MPIQHKKSTQHHASRPAYQTTEDYIYIHQF